MNNVPNIILIVMDTVRADHLSCYGYHRKTTPNIDRIAGQGVLYDNAFSAAPWTPPSHASIFTGKYPSQHKTIGKDVRFKEENTSLAEILRDHGFRTIGITGCQILGPGSGFEKGFEEYIELKLPSLSNIRLEKLGVQEYIRTLIYGPDKGTHESVNTIKGLLQKNRAIEEPFFVFVNFFTCHTPYDPPRPFKRRYCASLMQPRFYIRELLWNKILDRTAEGIAIPDLSIRKLRWVASGGGGFAFAAKQTSVSSTEWEIVKSWYDGEIAYLDYQIGNLFAHLRGKNLLDNTLIVITSDHGENFGDHGLAVHPLCVYDSLLRVPLIMNHPKLIPQGKRLSNLVSTTDIFPTLLDICGIEFDHKIPGRSLRPFEDRQIHDFICAEYGGLHTRGFGGLHAWKLSGNAKDKLEEIDVGCKCIRTPNYKYIMSLLKEELYDIRKDPLEQTNLVDKHPDIAKSLKKQLDEMIDLSYFGPKEFSHADEKDKEMVKRLKALGYI